MRQTTTPERARGLTIIMRMNHIIRLRHELDILKTNEVSVEAFPKQSVLTAFDRFVSPSSSFTSDTLLTYTGAGCCWCTLGLSGSR